MIINIQEYRDKLQGCWMGKNIGSTLGQPFQWKRKINDITTYTHHTAPPAALDIHLLWLRALEDNGVHTSTSILSEYFLSYLSTHSEGPAKAYMQAGLMPPLCSMSHDYRDSTGAFSRSEIWACIAPGCPEIAATKAYTDASIDHGAGEGLYAAIFIAVVQSAAFIEDDPRELIDIGLSYIPQDCGIAQAVKTAQEAYEDNMTWLEARDKVLQNHRGHYAAWEGAGISQRDWDYGLADGPYGYDAPANIAMIIIGWLYGEGDFGRSICTTVNCGEDTVSNAAALGAILGIVDGRSLIPQEWADPITSTLATKTIDTFAIKHIPKSTDELSARVERLAKIIMLTYRPDVELTNNPTNVSQREIKNLINPETAQKILRNPYGPIYENGLITCSLDYINSGYIKSGGTSQITVKLSSKLKHDLLLNMKWYLPNGFKVSPAAAGLIHCPGGGVESLPVTFEIEAYGPVEIVNRFVMEFTSPGRHTVALVPVILLDGGML